MSTERLIAGDRCPSSALSLSHSIRCDGEPARIFEELPKATIVSVSRADASDITPLLLSYTIELEYKQFKWHLLKKASQVIYLHLALKKRALIKEFHEKQEQIKEWLQSVGLGDDTTVVHDEDEPDDGAVPIYNEDGAKNRNVRSGTAFLSIIRPAIGNQQNISDKAKVAMQGYLNHFLGNLDIINSREVCKFLEVSNLSFLQEYGPKLKEGYVTAKHLTKFSYDDDACSRCFLCHWCSCSNNWRKEDPFCTKLLDIIVFDVLPTLNTKGDEEVYMAKVLKERNPLRHAFQVSCGNRSIKLRTTSSTKVRDWVSAINEVGLKPSESWCQPQRFNSFAPTRGLIEDGSHAQWFVDGKAAFEAITSSLENAKSEIYITGWWVCPELYFRRPFHNHISSRLDVLLEAKAKQGVQIYILLYKEVSLALKINSSYSKRRLLSIHENVRVLRYPDHLSTGVYLWSHHEKIVIVDHKICFIGGLDLCFGRYDTIEHKVGDFPPLLWPGKDYYNPRESEPNSWEDALKDELDREKYPRMPWHDVHCALWGPPCRDIARHFIQRWNHAKKSKAPNEQKIPLLMPHHHMVLPHYMGRSKERDIYDKNFEANHKDISRKDSFSSESPPEDVPLLLPPEANGPETLILERKPNGLNSNECCETPLNGHFEVLSFAYQQYKYGNSLPDMNTSRSAGDHDWVNTQSKAILEATASESQVKDYWCETLEQGSKFALSNELAQVGPRTSCHCQKSKAPNEQKIPLLMPHHHMVLPHYMGRSKERDIYDKNFEANHKDISRKDSFSSESPPEDVPLLLPPEANGPETLILERKPNGLNSNECCETPLNGHFEVLSFAYQQYKYGNSLPDMNTSRSAGDHDWVNTQSKAILEATASESQVKDYWCETLEQGSKFALSNELAQVGPRTSCHCQKSKAPNEQKIPLLMPHHHMVLPHYMGRSKERDIYDKNFEANHKDISRKDSFSSESPPEDVPLLLPPEANGPETLILERKPNGLNSNECCETPLNGHFEVLSFAYQQYKYGNSLPDMNTSRSAGDHDWVNTQSKAILEATASESQVKDYWCETLEQGSKFALSNELAQVGPRTSCHCQVVRSVSQWSAGTNQTEDSIHRAYCSLIEKAEHFVYIENQFFISGLSEDEVIQNRVLESLYNRIIWAHRERKCFRAIIIIPLLPGFQGGVDDSGAATVRAIMHWQYRTICRGESSILQKLCSKLGQIAHDFISFYGLRTYGRLFDGGPVVTSQVYVHSKVMIVDDRCALVGSSNINDRSLLGSRDSEIAVLIEDTEFVESSMNEKPWKAGKFSLSLRLSLWGEHLGLNTEELSRIRDPMADSTFKDLWVETAKANSKIYQDVFSCIPNDLIHSRSSLRQNVSHWKQKLGHTTIDLGVSSSVHESYQNGEHVNLGLLKNLKSVKGLLVSFPLEFMSQEEDLRPMFIEGEFYASPQVFH